MIDINPDLTSNQKQALKYMFDDTTTELLYGGAAGGGKSFLLGSLCYYYQLKISRSKEA